MTINDHLVFVVFFTGQSLKFWRSRFILLPSASQLMRKLSDQSYKGPLDVFEEKNESQKMILLDGFLRFVEGLNRRRRAQSRPPSKVQAYTIREYFMSNNIIN